MVDNTDDAGGEAPAKTNRWWAVFRGEISLGNLLILAGMVSTGAVAIYTVGGSVQRLQDALEQQGILLHHETEMRQLGEKEHDQQITALDRSFTSTITTLAAREGSDIAGINSSIQDLRTDLRTLVNRHKID